MNLNQVNAVIAALDKKAEDYKAAADSLRTVLAHENAEGKAGSSASATSNAANANAASSSATGTGTDGGGTTGRGRKAGASNAKAPKTGGKRTMSEETRAKIAAAIKARHAERKQGA